MDPRTDSYTSPDTALVVRQDPEVQLSAISFQLSDCNKAGLASNALLGILRLSPVWRVQVSLPTYIIISGVWFLF